MPDVMVARRGAVLRIDGVRRRVYRERTTAHVDAQVVRDHPELWRPIDLDLPADVDYPAEPAATTPASPAPVAAPEPAEAATDDESSEPAAAAPAGTEAPPLAKDVRAWARAEGLDVSVRGPLPDDLVERYVAAHGG
jgi:hypothetical protein